MDYILLVPSCTNGHIGIGYLQFEFNYSYAKKRGGEGGGICLFKNNNNISIKLQVAHHM